MASFKEEMEADNNVLRVVEFVKGRLFFVTFVKNIPRSTKDVFYFTAVDNLPYQYDDYYFRRKYFDVLTLYSTGSSFTRIKFYLQSPKLASKALVQFTLCNSSRVFAAFLMGVYAMVQLKMSPVEAFEKVSYAPFQEALMYKCTILSRRLYTNFYNIRLMDCLNTVHKAVCCGLVNFDDFNADEFYTVAAIKRGACSWIVPQKLLVIRSPIDNPVRNYSKTELYLEYFKNNNVKTIIRIAGQKYDVEKFNNAGVSHYQLQYKHNRPTPDSVTKFFDVMENSSGAVAVHCMKGWEPTGILVALYLMKYYRMTALEAIIWIHLCRPRCAIKHMYPYVEAMEASMWNMGDSFRIEKYGDADRLPHHEYGVHSYKAKSSMSESSNSVTSAENHPLLYWLFRWNALPQTSEEKTLSSVLSTETV